jgi:hypothetical protein
MASFVVLLSNHGILPSAIVIGPHADASRAIALPRVDVAGRYQPPDSPPPRV